MDAESAPASAAVIAELEAVLAASRAQREALRRLLEVVVQQLADGREHDVRR